MDLGDPARVLLPAGTSSVIRVLASADTKFTMRQVARLAGVSAPVARSVVLRLAEHGLVLTTSAGRSTLCWFNASHLAAEPVRALVLLKSAMLQLLRDVVESWSVQPLHASLFGSAARSDGDTSSDIDVLLVRQDLRGSKLDAWEEQLFASSGLMLEKIGNPVSWFVVTQKELVKLVRASEPVVESWRTEGITLFGPTVTSTLRAAS